MWLVKPIITRILHAKYDLNRTQHIKFLRYHCSCHGNLVTAAMRYVAYAYHSEKASYQT